MPNSGVDSFVGKDLSYINATVSVNKINLEAKAASEAVLRLFLSAK